MKWMGHIDERRTNTEEALRSVDRPRLRFKNITTSDLNGVGIKPKRISSQNCLTDIKYCEKVKTLYR